MPHVIGNSRDMHFKNNGHHWGCQGIHMNLPTTLSLGEFELVFNMLSPAVAAMFGSFVYFVLARHDVAPKYRL